MPLIDLKTDLKSLKYGQDRPGGGDSNQPYIKVDINTVDRNFNRFRMTKFDDGLVRGGVVGAVNASVVDTLRIGKFLKDFPKGPLFIVRQIGLQLSNPRIESKKLKIDNPTTGGGLLRNVGNLILNTANKIVNAVGPTRIYNLGINTLAQIPVNAFGVHFNRHGLLPIQNEDTKYLAVAQHNNEGDGAPNNRLVGLASQFRLGDRQTENIPEFNNKKQRKLLAQALNNFLFGGVVKKPKPIGFLNANKELVINRYIGGPGSVYGIGNTTILRKVFTEDSGKINKAKNKTYNQQHLPEVKIKNTIDFGVSNKTNSSLSDSGFDLLNDSINNSFLNFTGSIKDYNTGDYRIIGHEGGTKDGYTDASRRIMNFTNISDKSGSEFAPSATFFKDGKNIHSVFRGRRDYTPLGLDDKTVKTYKQSLQSGILTGSKDLGIGSKAIFNYDPIQIPVDENSLKLGIDKTVVVTYSNSNPTLRKYKDLQQRVNNTATPTVFKYNNSKLTNLGRGGPFGIDTYNGFINSYTTSSVEYNNGIDAILKLSGSWNTLNRETRIGSGRQDSINLTPIFSEAAGSIGDAVNIDGANKNINDLVKFRIQALNGDDPTTAEYMIFRAYLTQYSDSSDATWNSIKYNGRGEDLYIYTGFSRKIQIGFKVAALSEVEMKPMYQKLNYLMGNTMPDYKDNLLMRGPLVRMTVGNWIDGQPGFLNNVSYTIPQDSPWEIGLGDKALILPHVVEVSMTFTPIGSQTQNENKISSKSRTTSHIAQNYNGNVEQLNYIE